MSKIREEKSDKSCKERVTRLPLQDKSLNMCKFSESNRQKLGNAIVYIARHTSNLSKTKLLKLLYLMEERMALKYHVPFIGLPFEVWQAGPVAKDVFIEIPVQGARFSDNFFDLLPGEKRVITIESPRFTGDEEIAVRHIRDTY